MKRFNRIVATTLVSLGLVLGLTMPVMAQPVDLQCLVPETPDNPNPQPTDQGCDLSLDTQVSVNSGAFADDTSGAPISANIGDTITWKITVSDLSSDGEMATGIVTVNNVLPTNFTLVSVVASAGTYGENNWTLTAETDLPATLTLTTTATASGLASDAATLTDYTSDLCDGPCADPPYVDSNAANNSHTAYVLINGKLVAVTSKVPNTGLPTRSNAADYAALLSGLVLVGYAVRRSVQHTN